MLRALKATDVASIYEINKDALGYDFSPEETASQLAKLSQDSHHFLLGYEDDTSHELVGYIHAEVYESLYSKAGFNILALAVLPQSQGRGFDRDLLEGLEKETKRRSYEFIRLNSADHRLGAHAFYEKVGYTCDKVQKRFIKLIKGEKL
ncbi:GNAT family N-acetyltransferase [Streptococcus infantis]|uniref:GNAT family N-acetyltransferase n=1 Tax=Streptococcus infantis TaxID=68892 RepID=UPI001CC0CCD5|nr:GNAT family N-acetyltransferase [Streptococcus infantis]MBZ2119151.1 GNAT family N-acetyltransferase [Streptococcus infantis]MBZ2121477.1 GNAT family N-acetyltransferase [Streptococcus infantis]MBZ2125251.1 GNAT family N-acetyltransferase [Streptococcus infantis]